MRRILLVAAMWTVAAAACSRLTEGDAPHFSDVVPLTAPSDAMHLPIDGASVTFSAADTVSVQHASATPSVLVPRYRDALTAAGWTMSRDDTMGEIVSQTWTKDAQTVVLSLQAQGDVTLASLSLLPL